MAEYINRERARFEAKRFFKNLYEIQEDLDELFCMLPADDVAPVRHGRWLLQANNERTNNRWNVTAECSECCDEGKEIWGGFISNVPDWLARNLALASAKSVKLSNYCPNCGAKMDLLDECEQEVER